MSKRADVVKKFETSRRNLLSVVIFSLINVLLSLFNSGIVFLFSASFPLYLLEFGKMLAQEMNAPSIAAIAAVISFIGIALYGVCYLLSKKHRAFILVALVLFSLDALFLLWTLTFGFEASFLLDIVFHIWVMYYLIVGTKAWADLKKMPFEEETEEETEGELTEGTAGELPAANTQALRPETAKGRVIISQMFDDLEIKVKRVFNATELIVNGMVYAERTGIVESAYEIEARVEGVFIQVTMDMTANMCLYVDGNLLAKKKRLV